MPSFLIRDCRVVRFMPSRAAAPVGPPIPQLVEPIIEINAKLIVRYFLRQIRVRGSHQASIHTNRSRAAQALKFLFLEHAQELRLKLERDVADLVEKDRATVREFEPTDPLRNGARKCALLVPEQLAFEEPGRNCRAVHFHEGSLPAAAEIVYGARDQFLAGPGFT